MLKFGSAVVFRLGTRATVRKYSAPIATSAFRAEKEDIGNELPDKPVTSVEVQENGKSGLVASVFASLNDPSYTPTEKKPSLKSAKINPNLRIDIQIKQAVDLNSLLLIAEGPIISRRHALKIVSVLSEWSSINKIQLPDFEKDPRFLRLCRILARTPNSHAMQLMTKADDLSTVLGITGDDEAARLISNLTLSQMIKVMQALSQKGRRSTPLLRALANNIIEISDVIDLKRCADLLYSMAALNFPDPVLMDRICDDVVQQLPDNDGKVSVVTSIVTSLGLLRYRHEPALAALARWTLRQRAACRPQDAAAVVVTLGALRFVPHDADALFEMVLLLKESDLVKTSSWLDLVFSLLILGKATEHHLASTLRPEFIEKMLMSGEIPVSVRRKLMTIDAYISLTNSSYSGPRLADDISVGVPIVYNKEKQLYVQSIMETFKNFISSGNFLRKDCNSGMGFLYDGEFVVDSKCHPVPLSQAAKSKNVFHIAILGLDYHDMCRKTISPLGVNHLYTKLLELKGFKVLQIPYSEFNPRDKLITRVQYIEKRLKEIIRVDAASS